ncbi:PREDICTED: BTB/POZ domain-containing protein At5g48510-like [Camelina sativa]|uniref:BTB/POZ domain-containing protein At5g48510-like n=1 Tax=Camelina sativa TaxID=90675 RepID=A0ABM0XEY1_CAMSA|nr:PREDICTED: BTB/POZ domain-containing protein At5g48510-like [Camelina sativa]
MATPNNKEQFSGGLAKVLAEQWQVDVRLKAVNSDDEGSAISAHKLILYLAADKYEIPHLRDLCRTELISSLSLSNSLDLLELAQIPFDKVLNDAAFGYIKTNISTIASSDEFKLFVASSPNLAVEIMKASLSNSRCYSCGYNNAQYMTRSNCYSCGRYFR